ncbi:trafficking protein particle complex subunit 13-like protein [Leptotrombidium deliense]|uniref:Trafficking protein particle complex subunit 13-like protein n=1 Tax=Leptotrombidium deliense TaxID=299467 RepID=A0A443SAT0_9ACAR|nr:trafficking protein particle complex subunit 13-like protein [Leptotrombidium deliense]
MHHEVKELGVHVMICTIRYVTKSEEQYTFRKYFRFQVFKPLDVKTKFYNAENDEVYLESLLQNLTAIPLCLEKVSLEPSEYFIVKDMNKIESDNKREQFNSNECRQYLFCLTPKPELRANINLLKSVTVIGKLDIVGTSAIGVKGHLQTSPLERMPPNYNDIRLTVEGVPSQVALKQNKQDMEPYLYFDNKSTEQSILWLGISGKSLDKLAPLSSAVFSLTGYPIKNGLHPIPSIRITDVLSKNHYDFSEIAYVFVNETTFQ